MSEKIVTPCTIDDLGRIVIPMSICKTIGLKQKTPINIILQGNRFILNKYTSDDLKLDKIIGIIRKMGSLNRLVLPKELLKEVNISPGYTFTAKLFPDDTMTLEFNLQAA